MSDVLNPEIDFPILVSHCIDVMGALAGEPIAKEESWISYSEGIGTKLLGHLVNVFSLYNGTKLKFGDKQNIKFIDFASMNILTRAAFEAYLCFYFIFRDSKDVNEREFRFLIWDLAGYLERQGFIAELEESRKTKNKEKLELDSLVVKIRDHQYFRSLDTREQARVLNSNWKFGKSIPELAELAGFDKEYFGTIYSYLCGYSHNSRNSVMQVYQAKDLLKQKVQAKSEIGLVIIILANFIKEYSQLHPKTDIVHNGNKYANGCCNAWIMIGKNMKKSS